MGAIKRLHGEPSLLIECHRLLSERHDRPVRFPGLGPIHAPWDCPVEQTRSLRLCQDAKRCWEDPSTWPLHPARHGDSTHWARFTLQSDQGDVPGADEGCGDE